MKRFAAFALLAVMLCAPIFGIQARFSGTDLMTGKSDSCMLSMLVRRLGSDDHNAIIRLLEFDIHYLSETRGSIAETGDH